MSDAAQPRRSSRTLWLIAALAVAPVLASYFMYYFWPPAHTVNHGTLLEPVQLPDPPLVGADGTPFRLSALRGRWVLISLDRGACDDHCEKKLVYMRQLRLTQGKNMDRIERLWLVSDDAAPRNAQALAGEGTRVARADAALLSAFPAAGSASDHLYLVDPLGNLMLRFPREPDPSRMIKDLQRVLRYSRIG